MSFSDDDLRVLKSMCESGNWPISGPNLLPLLARMDAAESYIEDLCSEDFDRISIGYERWRKSCGR